LWIGDGGCHTGFSKVTHEIGDRLVRNYGDDISVLAINHRGDHYPTPMKLYSPTMLSPGDVYGFSRVTEMLGTVEPDVVVMVNDPFVVMRYLFSNKYDAEKYLLQYRPILAYMPIDGIHQPGTWQVLANVVKRVAMTKFGRDTWMPEAPVVYHGLDTETFYPVTHRPMTMSDGRVIASKKDAKRAFGFDPDAFLVLRVDRNSTRKNYPDTIKALWPVMRKHSDIIVHLHCEANDSAGYNLAQFLTREPKLKDRFQFPGGINTFFGWPEKDLAVLYNAADLYVSTTAGEGFGLTLLEAAACGVPIVAPDCSTIPEVVGPGAALLLPEREQTVPPGHDQWLPDVGLFSEAIEKLYLSRGMRRDLGEKGAAHALGFSWDFAAAKFHDLISELATASPEESDTWTRGSISTAAS
jgi:glycosyltransferase involved in cell wall biosynthesis